ncbi:MAG TPA: type IV secretion protein Rhs [Thermoanaerobaculia bacterium]|nr:type IV secretion protein Rhs [Thermoanaerobaculia bacterium]
MPSTLIRTSTPQSGIPADVYAPSFRIEVEERELDPESRADLFEVKVVLDLEGVDSFDLSFDNWDDRRVAFKHGDSRRLDLGSRISVKMGYADRLLWMVRGQVTALAPQFPESGPRTLGLSGLGGMFRLRDHKRSPAPYRNKADWEIALEVAERNGLQARVTRQGPKNERVVQREQDDASFLKERARRIGFDCFTRTEPDSGDEILMFVRSEAGESSKAPLYVFEWGRNLLRFSPVLDVSRQVGRVALKSWDPGAKKTLLHVAGPADLPSGRGRNGAAAVEEIRPGKEDLLQSSPVLGAEEALDLAIAKLREHAYGYATGSAQVIGLPDLRPGDNARFDGVGRRFGGIYQVTRVEHTINSSGYLTQFNVRRTHDEGTEA